MVDHLGESFAYLKPANDKCESALHKLESGIDELWRVLAEQGITGGPTYRERHFLRTRALQHAAPRPSSAVPKRPTLFQPIRPSAGDDAKKCGSSLASIRK